MAHILVNVTANIRLKIGETSLGVDLDDYDDYSDYKDAIEDEAMSKANSLIENLPEHIQSVTSVEVDETEVDSIDGRLGGSKFAEEEEDSDE